MRKALSVLGVGIVVAVSIVPRAGAAGLASGCVEAGLKPPTLMKAYFELSDAGPVHRNVTIPRIHYRYRFGALPSECQGKAIQVVEVKVRYKTSEFPGKTLRVWQTNSSGGDRLKTWMSLYRGDAGTGLPGGETIPNSGNLVAAECQGNGYLANLGTVQRVSVIEKRTVKEVGAGSVWSKTRPLPVTFSRARKHDTEGHSNCYQTEPVGH